MGCSNDNARLSLKVVSDHKGPQEKNEEKVSSISGNFESKKMVCTSTYNVSPRAEKFYQRSKFRELHIRKYWNTMISGVLGLVLEILSGCNEGK